MSGPLEYQEGDHESLHLVGKNRVAVQPKEMPVDVAGPSSNYTRPRLHGNRRLRGLEDAILVNEYDLHTFSRVRLFSVLLSNRRKEYKETNHAPQDGP